jgi:hypothetical protein
MSDRRTILILSANPKGTNPLRLGEEIREIKEGLRRSKYRDLYQIETAEAVRVGDIQRAMLDYEPNIVHFCGHGGGQEGLVFEDVTGQIKLVSAEALAGLFSLFADRLDCVLLNACYSEVQAKEISRHINSVIGMSQAIGDKAAIAFAVGFYDALGANRGVDFAYRLGCNAISLSGIAESERPKLLVNPRASRTIFGSDAFTRASKQLTNNIPVQTFKNIINNKTQEFVGRNYIFEEINYHLEDKGFSSGYIIIKGEPGIGKTALMAELINQKNWVHHFITEGFNSTESFLANICSQIIIKYDLSYSQLPVNEIGTEERIRGYKRFLDEELLPQAIERANQIIILVDALDEAQRETLERGFNLLCLPRSLPEGVFFIVTSREAEDHPFYVDSSRRINISDNDPRNLDDVRQYIRNFLEFYYQGMEKQIQKWKVSTEKFIEIITQKSEGNFMYLYYVLRDIRDQTLSQDINENIYNLPQGLYGYYNKHWGYMEQTYQTRFRQIDEKVIRILGAVREPISVAYLAKIGHFSPYDVGTIINLWRSFFNERISEHGEILYHLYHKSFYEFLKRKLYFDDVETFDEEIHDLISEAILSNINF